MKILSEVKFCDRFSLVFFYCKYWLIWIYLKQLTWGLYSIFRFQAFPLLLFLWNLLGKTGFVVSNLSFFLAASKVFGVVQLH